MSYRLGYRFFKSSSNSFVKSTDGGNTWSDCNNGEFGGLGDIKYNGSMWMAALNNRSPICTKMIMTSPDGDNWTERTGSCFSPQNADNTPYCVGWNGSYWLIGGYSLLEFNNGNKNKGYIAKSTDGVSWTHVELFPTIPLKMIYALEWNGSYWLGAVLFYNAATTNKGCFIRSTNGVDWTVVAQSPFGYFGADNNYTSGAHYIVWNGSYWLAKGSVYNSDFTLDNTKFIAKSFDGVSWSYCTIPTGSTSNFFFKWGGSCWIGIRGFSSAKEYARSTNGTDWTVLTMSDDILLTYDYKTSISWDGSLWHMITVNNEQTSIDGITWNISRTGTSQFAIGLNLAFPVAPIITTLTAPGAPTGVTAVASNGSATVSWTAPASNGSPITAYTVTPSIGTPVTVGNVLTATLTGLTNGTAVTFTVNAVSSSGTSVASSASASVTPTAAPTAPGAPTGVSAVAGTNSATVSWTAPSSNGSAITGYTVTPSVGNPVTVGNVLTATITGLSSGTAVTFTVKATNAIGTSLNSLASSAVTPTGVVFTPPGAPTGVTVVAGHNSATVSWTAPESSGSSPIIGYTITPSVGSPVTVGNVLTATIPGLPSGTSVTFTVAAINASGASSNPPVSPPVIPTGPPSAVLDVKVTPGVASAVISWSPPVSNGGSPITGYKVICVPDNKKPNTAGPDARSLTVIGLKNGALTTCTVVAINAAGQSNSASFTPNPLPGVPKVVAVRGASGIINLSWTAKPAHVSSPITNYVVSLVSPLPAPAGMVIPPPLITATGGSVSISGLTNGSAYVFSVKSVSIIGESLGGVSKPVIAAGLPDMPTSFVGTRALASAGLSWVAPTNTGGFPITGYIISYVFAGLVKTMAVKLVTSTIIKGLVNGTAYNFTIQAITLAGGSVVTAPVTVTPGSGV